MAKISLDEIRAYNLWWFDKSEIEKDKHIKEFEDSTIKWLPKLRREINLESDAIYSIRGPRQVGKTTLLKLMIKGLLDKEDSKSIMFYSCDVVTREELHGLLNVYLDWVKGFQSTRKSRLFIFLDEISSVKGWQKTIKVLYDLGRLDGITLIVTGSHSVDIKKSMELLPGRKGKVSKPDKEFLPMSFREYVSIFGKNLLQRKNLQELKPFVSDINRILDKYLITGGFPRVIDYYNKNAHIEDFLFEDYINWIIGDFNKLGKNEYYLKAILRAIIETTTTPVGWETLKKRTEVGSVNTVQDYVDDLKHSFLLEYIFNMDLSKKIPLLIKHKKIYIRDPFIFHAINRFLYNLKFNDLLRNIEDKEKKSKLVESVVCDHLSREFETFHWKGKKGKEADFVLKIKNELIGIEVKYKSKIKRYELGSLTKFKKALVLTKNEFDLNAKNPRIPVSVFLLNPKNCLKVLTSSP